MRKLSEYMDVCKIDNQHYGIHRDGGWEKIGYDWYLEVKEYLDLDIQVRLIELQRRRKTNAK